MRWNSDEEKGCGGIFLPHTREWLKLLYHFIFHLSSLVSQPHISSMDYGYIYSFLLVSIMICTGS